MSDKADVLLLVNSPEEQRLATSNIRDVSKVAIAGNEKVSVIRGMYFRTSIRSSNILTITTCTDSNKILLYPTFESFTGQQEPEEKWDFSNTTSEVIGLASNESTFTFLTANGQVYTFGDPRHNTLGRDLQVTPSTKPGLVDALDGVPIMKVSSGGWITAALSREGDLYIWGGRTGDGELVEGLQDLEGSDVSLVDLGGGLDVVDIAVGGGHLAALTADGRVWMVGRGYNGQIGDVGVGFQREWKEVQGMPDGLRAVGLTCGGWGTFVVLEAGSK